MIRSVVPLMQKQRSGVIVNINTVAVPVEVASIVLKALNPRQYYLAIWKEMMLQC